MANNQTWYFRQMDKQGRTLARIIWNGQKRMVLIAAAPNGIFTTKKKDVADILRSEGYMETSGQELRRNGEQIWAEGKPDPRLTNRYPIRRICHRKRDIPRRGTIVCVGSHFELGPWIAANEVKPDRIVLVCTNMARGKFLKRLHCLRQLGKEVEVTYSSALVREAMGQPDRIEFSPMDLQRFSPRPRFAYTRPESPIVGRLSRDIAKKHYHEDPALYMDLVRREDPMDLLMQLCTDRPLRERIGNDARETVISIYSKKWREELVAFYCC
jgi:hypothetical protein